MKNALLILSVMLMVSCKDSPNSKFKVIAENESDAETQQPANEGKKLLEAKCYVCHNPESDENNALAPPMAAIKARYSKDHSTKESFSDAIWNFVEKPTNEKVKMKGALNRFGLMPFQSFDEKEIRKISDYIFDYQIEEPEWFKQHWEQNHGEKNYHQKGKKMNGNFNMSKENLMERGMTYAQSTQKVLGKNLMLTLQKNGAVKAVEFCNERAYPLTDSMAIIHNAKIRRVTDKPRNLENQANEKELEYIEFFKSKIKNKETYEPILISENGTTHFYSPIVTNTMCLNCHGTPITNIDPKVTQIINDKYPYDKAIGYKENEVRGIWSITFNDEKNK